MKLNILDYSSIILILILIITLFVCIYKNEQFAAGTRAESSGVNTSLSSTNYNFKYFTDIISEDQQSLFFLIQRNPENNNEFKFVTHNLDFITVNKNNLNAVPSDADMKKIIFKMTFPINDDNENKNKFKLDNIEEIPGNLTIPDGKPNSNFNEITFIPTTYTGNTCNRSDIKHIMLHNTLKKYLCLNNSTNKFRFLNTAEIQNLINHARSHLIFFFLSYFCESSKTGLEISRGKETLCEKLC